MSEFLVIFKSKYFDEGKVTLSNRNKAIAFAKTIKKHFGKDLDFVHINEIVYDYDATHDANHND